jgi:hypothetical protein
LRRYLLGKELGYDSVKRMTIAEFEENWAIANLVGQCSTPEGKDELHRIRGVKKAIALENSPPVMLQQPFDPATATPEEIEIWMHRM